ncbi:hypothetical protein [Amycolatopsis sp. NPDC059021]|uniref:hypothetical protein n=1 Tax=Amycolatopsis sp. NPDC059021 TaxID=3346704 RepID=UPI00366B858D
MRLSDVERATVAAFIGKVSARSSQMIHGWKTYGSGFDMLQTTEFEYAGEAFTVVRDHDLKVRVFSRHELSAFAEALRNGECSDVETAGGKMVLRGCEHHGQRPDKIPVIAVSRETFAAFAAEIAA